MLWYISNKNSEKKVVTSTPPWLKKVAEKAVVVAQKKEQ